MSPKIGAFDYSVRVEISIPLSWAKILKTSAAHHYDYKCREAGESGVINGLYNVAMWNNDPATKTTNHVVGWRECDTMQKVMEGAIGGEQEIRELNEFLNEVRTRCHVRLEEIIKQDESRAAAVMEERGAR